PGHLFEELNPDFWLPSDHGLENVPRRKEIDFRTPDGQQRYLGISISPLRSRDSERSGYVFNFQDLTELRRLEQEVATKERMAALGRLSAAIAHEIRQPLTAMAGAVKELARLVPLEEDERHLGDERAYGCLGTPFRSDCARNTATADGYGWGGKGTCAVGSSWGRRAASWGHCHPPIGAIKP